MEITWKKVKTTSLDNQVSTHLRGAEEQRRIGTREEEEAARFLLFPNND